jgi:hypothetical protein
MISFIRVMMGEFETGALLRALCVPSRETKCKQWEKGKNSVTMLEKFYYPQYRTVKGM